MENAKAEMPNTVYNCLIQSKMKFSKKDLRKISNAINSHYKGKFGEEMEPEKVVQKENESIFTVYCYPEEMREEMGKIVVWFFQMKKSRAKKHSKLMLETQLEKLKKESPEKYEIEIERLKKEAEDKKRNALKFKNNRGKATKQNPNSKFKKYPKNGNNSHKFNNNAKYQKPDNPNPSPAPQNY